MLQLAICLPNLYTRYEPRPGTPPFERTREVLQFVQDLKGLD